MTTLETNRIAKADRLATAVVDFTEARTPADGAAIVENMRGWTDGGWALFAQACGEATPSEQTRSLILAAVERRLNQADPFEGLC